MLKLLGNLHKRERLLAIAGLLFLLGQCWLELQIPDGIGRLALLAHDGEIAPEGLRQVGGRLLGCAVGSAALSVPGSWCAVQAAAGFAYSLREAIFAKISLLGKPEMDRFTVSDLLQCITGDVNRLGWMLKESLRVLWPAFVIAVWSVVRMPGGEGVALCAYAACILLSLLAAGTVLRQIPAVKRSTEGLLALLEIQPAVQPGSGTVRADAGAVELCGVSFAYPGSGQYTLENVSFRVKKGQKVAVVGPKNSGKSTLLDLIARLYDPGAGEITVGGVDVRQLSFEALYDNLGYVQQTPAVLSGSVRSAVFFGESGAPNREDDLQQALALAGVTETVLPDKVEPGGSNLTEEQKVRLALARVLARRPGVLLVDDCGFAPVEQLCRQLLTALQDTTVLFATQRVELAKRADHILVLSRGRVAGQGTHAQLMQNCPAYRALVDGEREVTG